MDFNFFMPVRVVSGRDCVLKSGSRLSRLGKKALIITGKNSAKRSGALSDVSAVLEEEKVETEIFNKVSANPLLSVCAEAGETAKKYGADFVIAIGGGSVLDCAKAAAIFAANSFETDEEIYKKEFKNSPLPLVVIGTTAGTGSEVSPTAVITVDSIMEKRSITGDMCYPTLALCDPKYSYDLPRDITVSTALDTFAHATEGWFSKKRNTTVELFASKCLPETFAVLKALASGERLSEEQRDTMYYCSIFGGMILCIGTTFPHLLGYTLTDKRGVAHGQACAVFDKCLIEFCTAEAPKQAQRFFEMLHSTPNEVSSVLEKLISIPEEVKFSEKEIEEYSQNWTDENPKLKNVFGEFKRKDALKIFNTLFLR